MWTSWLFQTGLRKLFILGLVGTLAACGGGGGKKSDPAPASSTATSSSLSSSSSLLGSSSISSLGNSSSSATSSVVAPADTTPDSFSFPALTGAALNTNVTSAAITISGINTAVPISIVNGEYSIDGGAFTSAAGTVSNGQMVALKALSAATAATGRQVVITIGGISQPFSVVTTELVGGVIQGTHLNLAGTVTTFAGTPPSADGTGTARFQGPSSSVSDGTYLYIVDTGNNKIRKMEIATGKVSTLAGSGAVGGADGTGVEAEFSFPRGITINGTYLYVTNTNRNTIRQIEIATGVVTTFAGYDDSGFGKSVDGIGTAAQFDSPHGIATDGIYLYIADMHSNKIRKMAIATKEVTTLAGGGSRFGWGAADGIGSAATFHYPTALATDGTYLYIADSENHKIRRLVIATGVVTTLAGNGSESSVDGIGTAASFEYPTGLAIHGGYLYVADSRGQKIRKIEMATSAVTTLAGSGLQASVDGAGTAASFDFPSGITIDGAQLYVTDAGNNQVRKIEIATNTVTTLAGTRQDADGEGIRASFGSPLGVTTDGYHLYVADAGNNRIRKIEIATGAVTTLAGSGVYGGDTDGNSNVASFSYPVGVTTDGPHLYVTDAYNNKIRKIEIETGLVTTLAGGGSGADVDGPGNTASFNYPGGITTAGTHLYVVDSNNNKIRGIEIATGVVSTVAGSGSEGNGDGLSTAASFYRPSSITTDGANLYVTDSYNHKIRKINIATGAVTTFAGSGLEGGADGTGASASFSYPDAITTDGFYLYIGDNQKIRKIDLATGVVSTLAGSGSEGATDGVGALASFKYPSGLATDGVNLYVTDAGNNTIRKIE